jgi:hypothetical protein
MLFYLKNPVGSGGFLFLLFCSFVSHPGIARGQDSNNASQAVPDTLRVLVDTANYIHFLDQKFQISVYSTGPTFDRVLADYLKETYKRTKTLPKYLKIVYQTTREKALFKKGIEEAVMTSQLDVSGSIDGIKRVRPSLKFPILSQRKFN